MEKKLNKLPLDGIIVLDLTNVLSGPYATFILAELGANVIKIEKPDGDDSRKYGPFKNGKSGYFISLNRGKKSIVLDLKNIKDKGIFKKILKKTDILIDNFKPGILEKIGFSWSYLSKNFPKLIHGKISGFGETGPYRNQPAYDVVVQAMGGIMSITGKNKENMVRVGTSIGDITASLFCVIGVLTQLIRRNKTGTGSKLDLSMLDCQIAILENSIARYSIERKNPEPLGNHHPSISPFGSFRTMDSQIVIAIGNDKLFKKFCEVIDDREMINHDDYNCNLKRNYNMKKLKRRIEKKLLSNKTESWIKKLTVNKIPCSKIQTIEDIVKNPQVKNRKMILEYSDKSIKNLKLSGNPFKFSFMKDNNRIKLAPELNQDEEEVLRFFEII